MRAGRPRLKTRVVHPLIEQLCIARRKNKLSMSKLSKLTDISPDALGRWERGERHPDNLSKIDRWCNALGLELALRRKDEFDKRSKAAAQYAERLTSAWIGVNELQSKIAGRKGFRKNETG